MPDGIQTGEQAARVRFRIEVRGTVQGVGFRPFVFRLATRLGLNGWVRNCTAGVELEVEGRPGSAGEFLDRLRSEPPAGSRLDDVCVTALRPDGGTGFELRTSVVRGTVVAAVPPDFATCSDCLRELFEPSDRRYRYPFITCTACGPRFSLARAMPFDRERTSMAGFPPCSQCHAEYENPLDRRFHAELVCCPACGPQLELWSGNGSVLAAREAVVGKAAEAIREGRIVAVKGLGGFQLLCAADRADVVAELRHRKRRADKPLAVMVPDLAAAHHLCYLSPAEADLLASPEAPIVLLRRRRRDEVVEAVAPRCPFLGLMLPFTPLHHLLFRELGCPVVATSGNRSSEPICADERDALTRLAGVADLFLVHDRPVLRAVDDSVVRVALDRELIVRRARGYAPLPIPVPKPLPPILAVGAQLKNATAVSTGSCVVLSQHVGDLDTAEAQDAFARVLSDLHQFHDVRPVAVACDSHPDYHSTRYARTSGWPVIAVPHHYAHVLACLAEGRTAGPALGVAWDGTGHGPDGTAWGGEFLRISPAGFERVAHLRLFPLPGGDLAAREPRRAALGLLYQAFGPDAFSMTDLPTLRAFTHAELRLLGSSLAAGVNAPVTSSAGRLFDAVASITGLRQSGTYEGQAAAELEWAIGPSATDDRYPIGYHDGVVDWAPTLTALLADCRTRVRVARMAALFHNALVEAIVQVAGLIGVRTVALSGGCFQNVSLLTRTVQRLRAGGYEPVWHCRVPPNDGGIALGQVIAAAGELRKEADGCAWPFPEGC